MIRGVVELPKLNELSVQAVATNMTLVVVTLFAATLIVVVPAWKRFLVFLDHTPVESRRAVLQFSAVLIGPPVLTTLAAYISLLISSDSWSYYLPDVLVLMMLALDNAGLSLSYPAVDVT